MNKRIALRGVVALVGLTCAGGVAAQGSQLPGATLDPAACSRVEWHPELLAKYPRIADACQEAIVVDGKTWARFDAVFEQVETDGDVRFQLHDRLDTELGAVTIDPAPGQVAYIDERRTPFENLHVGQEVSLYVPEGQYGFASLPGAPMEQVAQVADSERRTYSDAGPVMAQLPDTAGPLPWLALGGALSMIAGLGVGLRRRLKG